MQQRRVLLAALHVMRCPSIAGLRHVGDHVAWVLHLCCTTQENAVDEAGSLQEDEQLAAGLLSSVKGVLSGPAGGKVDLQKLRLDQPSAPERLLLKHSALGQALVGGVAAVSALHGHAHSFPPQQAPVLCDRCLQNSYCSPSSCLIPHIICTADPAHASSAVSSPFHPRTHFWCPQAVSALPFGAPLAAALSVAYKQSVKVGLLGACCARLVHTRL